ncbi:hypothetical protein E2C01_066882 [Portunus trituberculatus]|uniref:Uncharacterized protein n=1 Tax=Portunus trituberculatus TaxID=210409 RepID=A0A5B7HJD9_PORTR|nr:hypothetical protein [Portunus trituberculatus]
MDCTHNEDLTIGAFLTVAASLAEALHATPVARKASDEDEDSQGIRLLHGEAHHASITNSDRVLPESQVRACSESRSLPLTKMYSFFYHHILFKRSDNTSTQREGLE